MLNVVVSVFCQYLALSLKLNKIGIQLMAWVSDGLWYFVCLRIKSNCNVKSNISPIYDSERNYLLEGCLGLRLCCNM